MSIFLGNGEPFGIGRSGERTRLEPVKIDREPDENFALTVDGDRITLQVLSNRIDIVRINRNNPRRIRYRVC